MSIIRIAVLLGAFTVLALTLVFLRTEQGRCTARMLALDARRIELRCTLWSLQTGVSRLRAPGRVRDYVSWFQVGVAPPAEDPSRDGRYGLASITRSADQEP